MTETALGELLSAPLGNLDLAALMNDGVHFGEHLYVVALGIGIDGTKHPLGLVEGSTENTAVVTELLTNLRARGLDTTRPILVGDMALRWCAAGLVEAGKQFRRVNGHLTYQCCGPPSSGMSPSRLSVPNVMMRP